MISLFIIEIQTYEIAFYNFCNILNYKGVSEMIYIGSDHAGFELKEKIIEHLKKNNVDFVDVGCYNIQSVDYPDIARKVCENILPGKGEKGILVCGTGIGISIAANKFKGIRAALCCDIYSTKYARLHNDANILCLGGRVIETELAFEITDTFLNTDFEGGRHTERLNKIINIENER